MIYFKKKYLRIAISLFAVIIVFTASSGVFAIKPYQKVDFVTGLVTGDNVNIRSGPSTAYSSVTKAKKNEYIRVFAQVGDWYIVQTDSDFVGAISKKYVKPIYPQASNTTENTSLVQTPSPANTSISLTQDERETFDLINKQRQNSGLAPLTIDNELQRVARIKAKDMVDNNYFSHTSPTYGSPFDMMNSFKINYRTAGENIAGNSSNSSAVTAWMNSPGHKANILNNSFTHTGLGVVSSPKYGKIYVQMFIGK